MFLTHLIAIKVGTLVFLFCLMLQGYCRSSAIYCSIYLLNFSITTDALAAHKLDAIYLSKRQAQIIQFAALFSLSALSVVLIDWLRYPAS